MVMETCCASTGRAKLLNLSLDLGFLMGKKGGDGREEKYPHFKIIRLKCSVKDKVPYKDYLQQE